MSHNIPAMVRRILARYDAATPEQVAEGTVWYEQARTFAADLADRYPFTFEQVAYVIAALSPQVPWGKNKSSTIDALDAFLGGWDGETKLPDYPGYSANGKKAHAILSGNLSVLRGPKVTAFAAAIMGDLSHTVVDVWATRAARSRAANLLVSYTQEELPGAPEHRAIAEAYRRAAGHRGIEPAVCQAVVWVQCRECPEWVRPQHMDETARRRFWKRQANARMRAGMTVPYDWNMSSPTKRAQYA